jgi:hypothetical protein
MKHQIAFALLSLSVTNSLVDCVLPYFPLLVGSKHFTLVYTLFTWGRRTKSGFWGDEEAEEETKCTCSRTKLPPFLNILSFALLPISCATPWFTILCVSSSPLPLFVRIFLFTFPACLLSLLLLFLFLRSAVLLFVCWTHRWGGE